MNEDMKRLCEAAAKELHGFNECRDDPAEAAPPIVRAVLAELRKISEPMMDAAHPHVGGSLITSGSYDDAFKATIDSVLQGE